MGPDTAVWIILAGIAGVLLGSIGVIVMQRLIGQSRLERTQLERDRMLEEAQARAKETELSAEKDAIGLRNAAEAEVQKRQQELRGEDERLHRRRESLDKRIDRLEDRERRLNQRQSRLDRMKNQIEELYEKQTTELERIASLTQDEAKGILLEQVEEGQLY